MPPQSYPAAVDVSGFPNCKAYPDDNIKGQTCTHTHTLQRLSSRQARVCAACLWSSGMNVLELAWFIFLRLNTIKWDNTVSFSCYYLSFKLWLYCLSCSQAVVSRSSFGAVFRTDMGVPHLSRCSCVCCMCVVHRLFVCLCVTVFTDVVQDIWMISHSCPPPNRLCSMCGHVSSLIGDEQDGPFLHQDSVCLVKRFIKKILFYLARPQSWIPT